MPQQQQQQERVQLPLSVSNDLNTFIALAAVNQLQQADREWSRGRGGAVAGEVGVGDGVAAAEAPPEACAV